MGEERLKKIECPNCGGELVVDHEKHRSVCQSCGSVFEIPVSEAEKAAAEKRKQEEQQVNKAVLRNPADIGKKNGKRRKGKKAAIILIVIAVALLAIIIPLAVHKDSDYSRREAPSEIDWNTLVLSDKLPVPELSTGYINENSSGALNVELTPAAETDMQDYLEQCRQMGYTVDEYNDSSHNVKVFNEEGYRLDLYYYSFDESMRILLAEPIRMDEIDWPRTGVGKRLPAPESNLGRVELETPEYFEVYVGDTSEKEFNQYIRACQDAGYTIDYSKYDRSFFAKNTQGDYLSVYYYGNNIMFIDVSNWADD